MDSFSDEESAFERKHPNIHKDLIKPQPTTTTMPEQPGQSSMSAFVRPVNKKWGTRESGQLRLINKLYSTDLFDGCTKLQAANKTRWNSQLKMFHSVVKIPQDVLNSLEYSGKPTAYNMKNISELCEVLLPFEEATDAIQGEQSIIETKQASVYTKIERRGLTDSQTSSSMSRVLLTRSALSPKLGRPSLNQTKAHTRIGFPKSCFCIKSVCNMEKCHRVVLLCFIFIVITFVVM
ncbi:hypothetical protein LSH36_857g00069 [Paralvinella palmiformis]|uniref:Uncharacterized protein n=1 Tax=Paralvinella palmiformis TaxID=53620 RepID=A0AAD9IZL1_9ANNE|nr:hypothetical protein LSH36_857g00069 [Paralvinella palmiformis]